MKRLLARFERLESRRVLATYPGLPYTGVQDWDAATGTLTFETSGTLFDGETIWDVPSDIKKIIIGDANQPDAEVRVTGSYLVNHSMDFKGVNREKSILYGTDELRWSKDNGVAAFDHSAIHALGNLTVHISNLTSLNPRGFHISGRTDNAVLHLDGVNMIDERGGNQNNSDGFVGGNGSTVRNTYIRTGDDALKLYKDTLVEDVVIDQLRNGAPIQLGWGGFDDTGSVVRNLTVNGISTTDWYNLGVISWKTNSASNAGALRKLTFEGLEVYDLDGGTIGGNNADRNMRLFDLAPTNGVIDFTFVGSPIAEGFNRGLVDTPGSIVFVVPGQGPYQGVPGLLADGGVLQAESYDLGGQGVAFNDTTPETIGSPARGTAVDGGAVSGASGERLGWIASGEWLEYTVDATAGVYDLGVRYAAGSVNGGSVRVLLGNGPDGDNFMELGTVTLPPTGNWSTYATAMLPAVAIPEGEGQVLRVEVVSSGFDLDFFEFALIPPPTLPGDYTLDGAVDAADYTVYRDQFGLEVTPYSGADGDGNGRVDSADRLVWAANYGRTAATAVEPASEAEPATAAVALVSLPLPEAEAEQESALSPGSKPIASPAEGPRDWALLAWLSEEPRGPSDSVDAPAELPSGRPRPEASPEEPLARAFG